MSSNIGTVWDASLVRAMSHCTSAKRASSHECLKWLNNVAAGFGELADAMRTSAKSLAHMFGAKGNPHAHIHFRLFIICRPEKVLYPELCSVNEISCCLASVHVSLGRKGANKGSQIAALPVKHTICAAI